MTLTLFPLVLTLAPSLAQQTAAPAAPPVRLTEPTPTAELPHQRELWRRATRLQGDRLHPYEAFGISVAIDGNRLLVGAPQLLNYEGNNTDAAHMYVRTPSGWQLEQRLTTTSLPPSPATRRQGMTVALDGDVAVVGAPGPGFPDGDDEVFVYEREGETWIERAMFASPFNEELFGYAVAVEGNLVAVGETGAGTSLAGAVFVYRKSGSAWVSEGLLPHVPLDPISLGSSLAIEGGTIAVGAPHDHEATTLAGAVYLYDWVGGAWTETAKLMASDAVSNQLFGRSVAFEGDTLLVGAPRDDDAGTKAGAVYVFTRSGSTWTETAKLTPSQAPDYLQFGWDVSLSSGNALIGTSFCEGFCPAGSESGSAYWFRRTGAGWIERARLSDHAAEALAQFGRAVDVSGNCALIGAWNDDGAYGTATVLDLAGSRTRGPGSPAGF